VPKVKAVLFDLFNTLVSEFGIGLDIQVEIATALKVDSTKLAHLYRSYRPERIAGRLTWENSLERIAQDCGVSIGSDVMDRLVAQREKTYRDLFFGADSAILRCLDSIRSGGFKTALVSNADGSDVVGFWESPLGPHFDAAIFSHLVGDPKPNPKMFRAACEAIGVEPSECLFVGDGGTNELSAAASLGITPLCAAWYLRRHASKLGPNIVTERSEGFPVLNNPSEIEAYLGT
jgi:putative hydrolase of the HAD superfamily